MALFKILRGTSTSLSSVPLTDGFAYFTPDDGRFYIDAALPAPPAHFIAQDETNGIYRIELRPSVAGSDVASLSFDYATSTLTLTKAGGATVQTTIPPLIQMVS